MLEDDARVAAVHLAGSDAGNLVTAVAVQVEGGEERLGGHRVQADVLAGGLAALAGRHVAALDEIEHGLVPFAAARRAVAGGAEGEEEVVQAVAVEVHDRRARQQAPDAVGREARRQGVDEGRVVVGDLSRGSHAAAADIDTGEERAAALVRVGHAG